MVHTLVTENVTILIIVNKSTMKQSLHIAYSFYPWLLDFDISAQSQLASGRQPIYNSEAAELFGSRDNLRVAS